MFNENYPQSFCNASCRGVFEAGGGGGGSV